MAKSEQPRESVIQRAALEYLSYRGIFCFRINQQGVPLHDGSGGFRPSPTRGISDILGILPDGRFLAVEIKRPNNNALTDAQRLFLEQAEEHGGVALVIHDLDELESDLKKKGY